jgi:hypothetical protein
MNLQVVWDKYGFALKLRSVSLHDTGYQKG